MTFDPLTLSICCRSGAMWSHCILNLSEIEHSAASFSKFWHIFTLPVNEGFQVPRTSQRLIYFWRGAIARAGRFNRFSRLGWGRGNFVRTSSQSWGNSTKFGEDVVPWHDRRHYTLVLVFRCVSPCENQRPSWKLSPFFQRGGGNFVRSSFPSWGTDLHQILGGYGIYIKVSTIRLVLRHIVPFRMSRLVSKKRGQLCTNDPCNN